MNPFNTDTSRDGLRAVTRLPKSTLVMAFMAGFANAVSMEYLGVACAHVTGHFTLVTEPTSPHRWLPAQLIMAYSLGLFTLSSLKEFRPRWMPRSGFIVQTLAFIIALTLKSAWSIPCLAFAMGLQNGYTSSAKNVRTTHLTGVLTDISHDLHLIIRDLRRHTPVRPDIRRFVLHSGVLACFILGSFLGWHGANEYGLSALIVPTFLSLSLCVVE